MTRPSTLKTLSARTMLLAAVIVTAACTVKETPAPPLTGPSEFGLSLALAAVPDLVTRDGFSQSTIVLTARDPQGEPVRSLQIRLDMVVNGVMQDFGSLSTKTLFTNNDGRATAVYTAPPAPTFGAATVTDRITFVASPVGVNQQGTSFTSADIRLVLPNTNTPGAPVAFFTAPGAADSGDTVAVNGSGSYAVSGGSIVNYAWDWGDGEVDSVNANPAEDHDWTTPGTYSITLTVTDDLGQRGSTSQLITIG